MADQEQINSLLDKMKFVDEERISKQESGDTPIPGSVGTLLEAGQDFVPDVAETIGAGTGALTGTALGTLAGGGTPFLSGAGAIAGGGTGAMVARTWADQLMGKPPTPDEEIILAGAGGAMGPALAGLTKWGIRFLTGIPSITAIQSEVRGTMRRAEAQLSQTAPQRIANRAAADFENRLKKTWIEINNIKSMSPQEIVDNFGTMHFANERIKDLVAKGTADYLQRMQGIFPKEIKEILLDPKAAASRASLMMQMPTNHPIGTAATIAALASGGDPSTTILGAAIGYSLDNSTRKLGPRLMENPRFRYWITGASGRSSVAQAALAFVGDVLFQDHVDKKSFDDTSQFFKGLLDFIEEFPADAFGITSKATNQSIESGNFTPRGEENLLSLPEGAQFTPRAPISNELLRPSPQSPPPDEANTPPSIGIQ